MKVMLKKYKKLEELVAQKQGQQSNDFTCHHDCLFDAMLKNLLLVG